MNCNHYWPGDYQQLVFVEVIQGKGCFREFLCSSCVVRSLELASYMYITATLAWSNFVLL